MNDRFPDADYYIAGSRFRPGMDGGYTIAALRRAQQFAEHGGVTPVLLSFELGVDHERSRAEFAHAGLLPVNGELRNLLEDLRADPEILRRHVADSGGSEAAPADTHAETDHDAEGRPWRVIHRDGAGGAVQHTDYLDAAGRPLMRIPYVARADWHRAPTIITVFDADGGPAGTLAGFEALYRLWLNHVLGDSGRMKVVICESRQVGELIANETRQDLRIVHTVHSAHTSAPYRWDSPIDGLWASWLQLVHRFDAVLWLTQRQRDDVERRIGPQPNFWVLPHAVTPGEPSTAHRDPNLVIAIGRLTHLKRFDHAIRAIRAVRATNPNARLHIYGAGPDQERLLGLVDELGVQDAVQLRGHHPDASAALHVAAALLMTSSYEGQGLVMLEALAVGCPVIAYDLNYGPAETIEPGRTGVLVPDGDVDQLTEALREHLGDADRLTRMTEAAGEWAREHTPERAMRRMGEVLRQVVEDRSRRG